MHQFTTTITSDPYAGMYLPPPTRSTSDIFDCHYASVQLAGSVTNNYEKNTFGTLPANSFGTRFSYRYTYDNPPPMQAKTRIIYNMDSSSPKIKPPKVPRKHISTANATSGPFASSYI